MTSHGRVKRGGWWRDRCHGVMIGRAAALGQPLIFAELAGLRSGDSLRAERAR